MSASVLAEVMAQRLDAAIGVVPEPGRARRGREGPLRRGRRARRDPGPAGPRRPPPRPDPAHGQRLEVRGLRGRARQDPRRAAAPGLAVARRRRDDPLLRLRPARRRGLDARGGPGRAPPARHPRGRVGPAQPQGVPGVVLRGGRAGPGRPDPAHGVRRRQGGLRVPLRGPQPPVVAVDPARRGGPARRLIPGSLRAPGAAGRLGHDHLREPRGGGARGPAGGRGQPHRPG
ncbi:hypothetical protein [Nocardioides convexus]|uniref:hypothetical protein n=1 Tax=Nocardioides convexus TaxID=2712224 RepID=UPI0024185684|nr:hypothetical protein [Nocardioides convexus]